MGSFVNVALLSVVAMMAAVDCGYQTTTNLKEIMIGRCWEYQRVLKPELFVNKVKDCVALWNSFYSAVSYKTPCGQMPPAYTAFTKAAKHPIDGKRILLWEKVYPLVRKFGDLGTRYVTLDSTLAGYMASSLTFCGDKNSKDGLNYKKCPGYRDCSDNPFGAFWKEISKEFSTQAEGVVNIMVNGSFSPTYRTDSIFAEWELPYLPKDKVKTLRILVVHNINGPIIETCKTKGKSLSNMKETIARFGFKVECLDDPQAVVSFLCTDAVDAERCKHRVKRYIR